MYHLIKKKSYVTCNTSYDSPYIIITRYNKIYDSNGIYNSYCLNIIQNVKFFKVLINCVTDIRVIENSCKNCTDNRLAM